MSIRPSRLSSQVACVDQSVGVLERVAVVHPFQAPGPERAIVWWAERETHDVFTNRPQALARWIAECRSIEANVRVRLAHEARQLALGDGTTGSAAVVGTETDSTRPRGT